jgi:hypothetical protein
VKQGTGGGEGRGAEGWTAGVGGRAEAGSGEVGGARRRAGRDIGAHFGSGHLMGDLCACVRVHQPPLIISLSFSFPPPPASPAPPLPRPPPPAAQCPGPGHCSPSHTTVPPALPVYSHVVCLPPAPSPAPPLPPPCCTPPPTPQLRAALALASILGRTLILPKLWCGLDRWWAAHGGTIPGSHLALPFQCPADHVLKLQGGFVCWRWGEGVPRWCEGPPWHKVVAACGLGAACWQAVGLGPLTWACGR